MNELYSISASNTWGHFRIATHTATKSQSKSVPTWYYNDRALTNSTSRLFQRGLLYKSVDYKVTVGLRERRVNEQVRAYVRAKNYGVKGRQSGRWIRSMFCRGT